jgi:hypothetical protein
MPYRQGNSSIEVYLMEKQLLDLLNWELKITVVPFLPDRLKIVKATNMSTQQRSHRLGGRTERDSRYIPRAPSNEVQETRKELRQLPVTSLEEQRNGDRLPEKMSGDCFPFRAPCYVTSA